MKLAFIAPAFGPNGVEQCALLVKSAEHVGIPLRLYGVGVPYASHTESKFRGAIEECRKLKDEGYSHVLYTDGFDALFLRGEVDIIAAYMEFGAPEWMLSAETNCWPYPERSSEYEETESPYKYLNAGGWIGRIDYLLKCAPVVLAQTYTEDDQGMITQAYLNRHILGTVVDRWCRVFYTANGPALEVMESKNVLNRATGTYPAVIHFPGRSGGREEMWRAISG
jgi:hypothetical protein